MMNPQTPPPLPPLGKVQALSKRPWWQPAVVNARWCIVVNLLGCPGLGTIMARQRGGYLQLCCMLSGTALLVAFLFKYAQELVRMLHSANPESGLNLTGHYWLLGWGVGLCVVAWLAAAFSSWRLWRTQPQKTQG